MSSSRVVRYQPVLSSKQPLRFQLSWRTIAIRLETGLSPAWRGLVETLRDYRRFVPEITGKQLELLKEIVPKLMRVAVLGNSTQPGTAQALKEMELASGAF